MALVPLGVGTLPVSMGCVGSKPAVADEPLSQFSSDLGGSTNAIINPLSPDQPIIRRRPRQRRSAIGNGLKIRKSWVPFMEDPVVHLPVFTVLHPQHSCETVRPSNAE